jgi:DNA mismatch repair protein MSH4
VQDLIDEIREHVPAMFKICESIAILDMVSAFAHLATSHDYGRSNKLLCWTLLMLE